MRRSKLRVLVLVGMVLATSIVQAKDLGVQGATFEIKEEGFIAMIQRRLKGLDMRLLESKMQEHAKKQVEEPKAISTISRAVEDKEFEYDPTYILSEDIYLPEGKLLYMRGTRVNPLDHMTWDEGLIFIDSRDSEQVRWLKKRDDLKKAVKEQDTVEIQEVSKPENTKKQMKVVLVGGKPLELEQELNIPIYFDQAGELTSRFGIKHVPAVVEQEGKHLKVKEIRISEK
jgi:conjugal transfer pilus assembly protein TraW